MSKQRRFAVLVLLLASVAVNAADPKPVSDPYGLPLRNVGPAAGGRVSRVCGVPGDPLVYYAATAGGGVWKSSDGGHDWKSIFDDQPVSSIGSIAVAPSDPNVVYVGSGEANIRGNVGAGNGIYRSTDAGQTWQHVWQHIGQIGTIVVHPRNANIAFAACLGSPFGPGPERGVYRTTDGGKSWSRVLFKDDDTGACDVAMDPNNPRILFAGLWQTRRKPWEMTSGGPGSGLYASRDGGDTWKQLTPGEDGLPKGPYGKIGVAVAPSDSKRVYALIEANDGGLFRSDDGGENWSHANAGRGIRQRAWYYTTVTVDPTNADVIWLPQVPLLRSIDGGANIAACRGPHHGDHHDVWIDPKNPKRMIDANDGGVDISTNGGKTWFAPPLPISQFYHVSCDNSTPYRVMGCMQDLGSASGPSRGPTGRIRLADWETVGGGEAGFVVPDPSNPDLIYAGEYGGYISRFDRKTGQTKNVCAYPINPTGITPAEMKYRFQWTAPILISSHDPKTIYHGANVVFRTTDAGESWTAISGDLTRNDKQKQQWSGGPITGDNTGVEVYGTVFALSESPKQKGLLWAGSDDGLVHVSKDSGATWVDVTKNIPDFPDWGTVRCIECSPFDANTAYLVAEAHRLNDFKPYVWQTKDLGATWTRLGDKLPQDVFLHVVRCDPAQKDLLYAGTERGVAVSRDDGKTFTPLTGMPTAAVHDLVVKGNDLVVGTMGRSLWVYDDLSALRAWAPALADKPVHLFAPAPATRTRDKDNFHHDRIGAADNPPEGAVLHYLLAKAAAKPVQLAVLDAAGKVVYECASEPKKDKDKPAEAGDYDDEDRANDVDLPTEPGLHRIVWPLETLAGELIPRAKLDGGDPRQGIPVPPGKYVVRLTVDGLTQEVPLEVQVDPRIKQDLAAQYQLALAIREDITKLSRAVRQLRAIRKQLVDRNGLIANEKNWEPLHKSSSELIKKLDELEEKLHNPKAKVAYDIFGPKGGAMLYSQLCFVYSTLLQADGPPTQGTREVYAEQTRRLGELLAEFAKLQAGDLAKLNADAKALDLPTVMVPPARPAKAKPKG